MSANTLPSIIRTSNLGTWYPLSTGQDRLGGWTAGFAYRKVQNPLCSFSLVLSKAVRSRRNMGSEGVLAAHYAAHYAAAIHA